MDDFVLMDEDGNEYSPAYDYYKRGYDAFFRFELNPGTSKRGISVNFIIPSNSKKKYSLSTNKDYIKLTTSKNGKKEYNKLLQINNVHSSSFYEHK